MKWLLKKNQIIIYVIAIMLMTAGYLNYTTKQGGDSVETSIEMDSKDDTKLADRMHNLSYSLRSEQKLS